jgi:hypothetical protein
MSSRSREATFDRDVSYLIAVTQLPRRLNPYPLLKNKPGVWVALGCAVFAAIILSAYWTHPMVLMTPERARAQLAAMRRSYAPDSFTEAARDGDAAAVSLFLRPGMKPDETQQPAMPSALEFAMDEGHYDVARVLIEGGADVEQSLLLVARTGNPELFHLLIGNKPSRKALAGALYQAAEAGHIEIVKQLLNSGLTPNDRWESNLPLVRRRMAGKERL